MLAEMENPVILIYDKKISTMKDFIPALEKAPTLFAVASLLK
jgi:chaperonin GroEL (HSP60 family)